MPPITGDKTIRYNGQRMWSFCESLLTRFRSLALPGIILLAMCAAAAADEPPVVAVVILPPQLSAESEEATIAAAKLASDQLASELEKDKSLRVVDRSQLDRVLQERQLNPENTAAIISYDAMVRLEVDTARPAPVIRLKIIDLSNGNIIAEFQHKWTTPPPNSVITKMAGQCRTALQEITKSAAKPLRVRLLGVENPDKSARLDPLAEKFRQTFENALKRSDGVMLVRHLEAQTAKEESLLLVMGLSRLPGGRQFAPPSDVSIELKIAETDATGKTFDQTGIELGWRIRRGENHDGNWASAEGKVADFDTLLKQVWSQCVSVVEKIPPGAACDYLNEMALRRKQAQVELDAVPNSAYLPPEQAKKRLEHIAAAAKLDPTWEEAAYQLVLASDYGEYDKKCFDAGIREALWYLKRFPADSKRRTNAAHKAAFWASSRFLNLRSYGKCEELNADALQTLDNLKEIIDIVIADAPNETSILLPQTAHIVYRGMACTAVPAAQRKAWLAEVIRIADRGVSPFGQEPDCYAESLLDMKIRFRMHATLLMIAEDDMPAAKVYFEQLLPLLAAARMTNNGLPAYFYNCIKNLDEPEWLAKLDAALTSTLYLISIDWPQFSPWGPDSSIVKRPQVDVRDMRYCKYGWTQPLAVCGGRLYFITCGSETDNEPCVGFVKLDNNGRPSGTMELLSAQPPVKDLRMSCKTVIGKKLYFGTSEGLLEYDSQKGAWRVFGPKEGLPQQKVYTLLPLDGGKLFCHGGDGREHGFFCEIDPAKSEIKLLRRLVREKDSYQLVNSAIKPVWRNGDTIFGVIDRRLYELPELGSAQPAVYQWPDATSPADPYRCLAWRHTAVAGGRRFLLCYDALREIDEKGGVSKTWTTVCRHRISGQTERMWCPDIELASDIPDLAYHRCYKVMAQDSSHLFFLSCWILCYEPASGTWYGPLETEPWTGEQGPVVSGDSGIWFYSGNQIMAYLDTADFIAAARKAGRVITSDEFQRRRRQYIEAAPPLERAKWAMCMQQWQQAREICAGILDGDPGNVEALLLMGMVHESNCLNKLDEAIGYYQRLADMKDNPRAAYTGLLYQYRLYIEAGRQDDARRVDELIRELKKPAAAVGKLIRQNYPSNAYRYILDTSIDQVKNR